LPFAPVRTGIARACASLSHNGHEAALAIMTTDTTPKEAAVRVPIGDAMLTVGGMAKGAGMIEPMLATMLAFVTTDAEVEPPVLQRALAEAAETTFNAITVDGECSTNDTVVALASGASSIRVDEHHGYQELVAGLTSVCRSLALQIVRGGEGATKLVAIRATGAPSKGDARRVARTIANSPLVKTALHGGDPNWGRLVAAAGRAGVPFLLDRAVVRIGPVVLFRNGQPFDEATPEAAEYLRHHDLEVQVDLGTGGTGEATVWTCDLSAEYVRINGEYRS
jgi:glutamate N-acetyltransferase/amino-acid N-acetyltransferase